MNDRRGTYRLAMLIREAYSLSMDSIDASMREYEVTPQQMLVIKAIAHSGGVQNSQLCKEMNLSKSTVSGIVTRMEKKNWIKRVPMEEDRRNSLIVFTKKGEEFAYSIKEQMDESFDSIFKDSSDEEINKYIEVLREMVNKMRGEI